MSMNSVWARAAGAWRTVVEQVYVHPVEPYAVVSVRPDRRWELRPACGICLERAPLYDRGRRRRWRSLDNGLMRVFLEAEVPRVRCARHGVVMAAVPWARHAAGHTLAFDETVAWFAVAASKKLVAVLLRINWHTVGAIVERVMDDRDIEDGDRLAGVRRIGIDEVSFRKGQQYLTIVVDHDSGRLLYVAEGRTKDAVRAFFDLLGARRSGEITHVSADGAGWIAAVLAEKVPQAKVCLDPFHVVKWATDALDKVRRQVWNTARRAGMSELAQGLKDARYALWKNPGAPRGALSYPRYSRERLEEVSLGLMTYPDAERRWGPQHVRKLATVSRYGSGVSGGPRDMAKAGLLESQLPAMQLPIRRKIPDTGAASCPGISGWPGQPPGAERYPTRVLKGAKRTPTSRYTRMTGTNVGSPTGREP